MYVKDDVKDPGGRVLVAAGAHALGKVTKSKKRGMFGVPGKLEFNIETVEAVDGGSVPLRAKIEDTGHSNKGTVIATALLLTVLTVFVRGRDVTVNEGTELIGYVDRDTVVNPPQPATSPAVPSVASPAPVAKLTVVSSLVAGSNVMGEIRNEGPGVCSAEVIVLVRKDDKPVGGGTAIVDRIEVGQVRAFSVPIQGSTVGTLSVEANAKPVPGPATQPPVAPAAAAAASQSPS